MGRPNKNKYLYLYCKHWVQDQRFWCAPIRVFDALVDIENDKKDFLVQKGFGKFLGVVLDEFDKYMGSWINNQYNTTDHTLTLPNGTVHHVVEDDFELVYGLPRGDTEVPSPTMKTDPGSLFPATLYELGDAVKRTRDVETWFKLFFVFLINSLCIGSSHDVERKFGHLVSNEMLLRFNNFNWCKYFLQLFKYTIAFEPKGNRRADYYFLVVSFIFYYNSYISGFAYIGFLFCINRVLFCLFLLLKVLYLVKSNKTNNSDCLLSGFPSNVVKEKLNKAIKEGCIRTHTDIDSILLELERVEKEAKKKPRVLQHVA
ncbi:unnamed protein product, partial [Linum tenue]